MKIRKKEKIFRFLLWFWLLLIVVSSTIPFITAPKIEIGKARFEIRLDYIFHFFIYFVFSIIFFLWRIYGKENNKYKILSTIIFLSILLAVIDEFHQKLVPGRIFNPIDLVYNFAGLFTGYLFSIITFWRKNTVKKS